VRKKKKKWGGPSRTRGAGLEGTRGRKRNRVKGDALTVGGRKLSGKEEVR